MKKKRFDIKKGDTVKCISSDCITIKKGHTYTVNTTMLFDNEELLVLTNGCFAPSYRFKKVK